MTPEDFVEKLLGAYPGVQTVILYGSAAAGDHVGPRSDYNVLVVADRLGVDELRALSKPAVQWVKAGNPAPLLFTLERLKKSADAFPIEILDIKESHRILHGENILAEVKVNRENLRLELEHELKSKLIQLRDRFLMTEGKPDRVVALMIESLSTFLVLFRAALRLFQSEVPALKFEALEALGRHFTFNAEVFFRVEALKEGKLKPREVDAQQLFDSYLKTIESVVDAIDEFIHSPETGGTL